MKTLMYKKIYRIEDPKGCSGMWYDSKGKPKKQIHILCPYGTAKDSPMPHNLELHRKDGKVWYSSAKSKENLLEWFTPKDIENLLANGYRLYEMEVSEYQDLEMETLFTMEGIISKRQIDAQTLWVYQ